MVHISYIIYNYIYIAEFLILFSLLPTSGFPFGHILSLRVALMIGRWHVWILGIACHSKCPNDLKFDQSCPHSHNTCLICLDSILMCQKLHHKIHNIWLFFLTFKNLLKRIDSTVDSTVDSIVLPVLPGPVASRRYLNSPTLRGAPRWRMPLFATAATEWPRPRLQGSKAPRVQGSKVSSTGSTMFYVEGLHVHVEVWW
jgi:hypothetical protein